MPFNVPVGYLFTPPVISITALISSVTSHHCHHFCSLQMSQGLLWQAPEIGDQARSKRPPEQRTECGVCVCVCVCDLILQGPARGKHDRTGNKAMHLPG